MGTVDLNDLSVFVAVVESASFTRAASRLKLPKSSVSRAVTRLEEAVGVPVLLRTTRKVALSTAGRTLYEKVREQVASLRQSVGEMPELKEAPSGRLRVTAVLGIELFLGDVVTTFVNRYPDVEIELRLTNDYVDLVEEEIDLALRFSTKALKDSTLTARKLRPSIMELYAAPSYQARRGLPRTPRELEWHEWVVYDRATELRLEGGGPPAAVVTKGRVVCNDFTFARQAIVNGCGIGYLSPSAAEADVAAGNLVRVLPRWHCPISNLWAVWPGQKLPRKASAFLDLVVQALKSRAL
jgi:DNA-binding transcriptional LysR family regulator